jgi:hypothetical protein
MILGFSRFLAVPRIVSKPTAVIANHSCFNTMVVLVRGYLWFIRGRLLFFLHMIMDMGLGNKSMAMGGCPIVYKDLGP